MVESLKNLLKPLGSSILLTLTLVGALLLRFSSPIGTFPKVQFVGFGMMFLSMTFIALVKSKYRVSWVGIVFFGCILRFLFMGYPVSDDFARYAWEGKIQTQGFNPYVLAPNHPELENMRDSLWQVINHKEYTAIYPPFFQLIQRTLTFAYPSPIPWQSFLMLLDILTFFFLLSLLKQQKIRPQYLALFALNPFCLVFFNGEAHLDSLLIFMGTLIFWAYQKQKNNLLWLTISLATLTKFFPLGWGLILLHKNNLKSMAWGLVPLLCIIPFLTHSPTHLLNSLFAFNQNFSFNNFFLSLFEANLWGGKLIWQGFLLSLLSIHLLVEPSRVKNLLWFGVCLVLMLPTIHPWYIGLFLPFWFIYFRWSIWILQISLFCGLLPMYTHHQATGVWREIPSASALVWVPFVMVFIVEQFGQVALKKILPRFFQKSKKYPYNFSKPNKEKQTKVESKKFTSLSIIIPTYNEEEKIESLIKNINAELKGTDYEVIVVDGGSSDNTSVLAKNQGALPYQSPEKGRGHQIYFGVQKASKDICVFIHADLSIPPGSLRYLPEDLNQHPKCIGGWHHMTFLNHPPFKLKIIEFLNFIRARMLLIGFGDQAQFCLREKALEKGLIYPGPLMEDVYFSLKLKELGPVLVRNVSMQVSPRKWKKGPFTKNVGLILWIVGVFCVQYRLHLTNPKSKYFIRKYYGKPSFKPISKKN